MTPFGVDDDEMPNHPPPLDDATVEAFLARRATRADQLGPLAGFAEDLQSAVNGPMPTARSDLATVLRTGLAAEVGAVLTTAGSRVNGPAIRAAERPRWRKARYWVADILAGAAGKAALGVSVAAASVLGAGATGILPASAQHDVATVVRAATPFEFPDPASSDAKPNGHGDVDRGATVDSGATPPGANTGGTSTGVDRADQTPAAGHVPTSPPGNTGGASTGLDRANQTPAGGHVPTSPPGAGAGIGGGAGSRASNGLDRAEQTPAAGHTPTSVGRR
jgi:hypothetical protein